MLSKGLRACLLGIAVCALGACGGDRAASGGAGGITPDTASFAPPDVDTEIWAALNRALRQSMRDKAASAPPTGTGAVVDDLALTANEDGSADFTWSFRSPGDYDQNGEVNLADLTPVGVGYGRTSSAADWAKYEPADGDSNGEINLADVTPIGANFGATLDGYALEHSATPGTEASWQPTGTEAPLSTAQSPPGGGRKAFSLTLPSSDPALVDGTYFRVRGYTGSGAGREYGQAGVSVQYQAGLPNQAPIAVLGVDPPSGLAPLDVVLDATGSGDIDGVIVKYEVDVDGPVNGEFWRDMGLDGILEFSFNVPADFLCLLRVTDDRGATDSDVALLKVRSVSPPQAALTAETLSGPTPLHVVWDASGSADTDGLVVRYEWDFDNDGEYEYDSGPVPTADFHYYEPGDYPAAVRVTDNDGLSATATSQASASLGASWHVQTVPPSAGYYIEHGSCGLLDVAGKPALCFTVQTSQPVADNQQFFQVASDPQASAWEPGSLLPHDPGNDLYSGAGSTGFSLGKLNNMPVYATNNGFWRAQDAEGSAWEAPIVCNPEYAGQPSAYLTVLDRPFIATQKAVLPGLDSGGLTWGAPIYLNEGNIGVASFEPGASAITIGGTPMVAIEQSGQNAFALFFFRATQPDGLAWTTAVVVDSGTVTGGNPQLLDCGGIPAILHYDSTLKAVKFSRALDALGKQWAQAEVLAGDAEFSITGGLWQGRPIVVYKAKSSGLLLARVANDTGGFNWSLPTRIDDASEFEPYVAGRPQANYFAQIAGMPALAYMGKPVDNPAPSKEPTELLYAAYW